MLFPHMCPNSAFFLTPSSWTVSRFLIYWIIHIPQGIWKEQLSSSRLGCRHLNRSMSHHTALQGWHTSSFAYRTVRAGNCSLWKSCHCLNLFTNILSLMVKAEVVKSNSCTFTLQTYWHALFHDQIFYRRYNWNKEPFHSPQYTSEMGFRMYLADRWPELKLGHHSSKEWNTLKKTFTVWVPPPPNNWVWWGKNISFVLKFKGTSWDLAHSSHEGQEETRSLS